MFKYEHPDSTNRNKLNNGMAIMSQTSKRSEEAKKILEQQPEVKGPRRSPTLLKMQWLAERVRKCERIRKQVEAGTYKTDSETVAKAMLGIDKL